MDSYKSAIIFCCLLASSLAASNDGHNWGYDDARKMTPAEETTLKTSGHIEFNLVAFNGFDRNSRFDEAPANDIQSSYCDSAAYKQVFKSGNQGSLTFFLYTPTADIDVNVELSKHGLNQQYMPQMQITSFSKSDFTDNSMTPLDDPNVLVFQNSMFCVANTGDVCSNSTMPISYSFRLGFSYLIQIYTSSTVATVGTFFLQMNVATQAFLEDFDNVANGDLPAGWVANINSVSEPTRDKRSTWIVGDYDYMSSRVRSTGQNGIYEPSAMASAGGPNAIKQFLGLNPTVPWSSTNLDPYLHTNEHITSAPIDLRSYSNLEFQFTATLDNQYRVTSQTYTDYSITVQYSEDNGVSWNWLIGGNFPFIVTGQDSTLWLTYQYNADQLAGKIVLIRLNFDQQSRDTSRFFGIDRIRFLTINHKMCTVPSSCMKATCTIGGKNPSTNNYGCGYTLEDSVCAGNVGVCTGSTCAPSAIDADANGCRTFATCAFTTMGLTTSEMTTQAMTTAEMSTAAMTTDSMTTNSLTTQSMTTNVMTTSPMTTGNEDGDVKEDPIFMGFNNEKFEFDGVAGKIYNIYNDPYVNLNTLFTVSNTETGEGTVMTEVGISIGGHNISLSTSAEHSKYAFEVSVDGVTTKVSSSIITLSGCVEMQYKDALLITTPLHKVFVYPHRHRKSRHINVEYFNIHIHHPDEDVEKIGGVLGQTASKPKSKIDLNEMDFVESSIFGREASRFYETKMMQC